MYLPFARKGFLVPVVGFGALLATDYAVGSYFHDSRYYELHGWPRTAGLWLAGVLVAGIWHRIGETESRTLIEPETGRAVVLIFLFTNALGA